MRLTPIVLIFAAYLFFASIVVADQEEVETIDFPTLATPEFDTDFNLVDLSAGCGGFTDCIEYLGNVILNIGAWVIGFIKLIFQALAFVFALIVYVIQIITMALGIVIEGIPGAPTYINLFIQLPFLMMLSLIAYRIFRSGESED